MAEDTRYAGPNKGRDSGKNAGMQQQQMNKPQGQQPFNKDKSNLGSKPGSDRNERK